MSAVLVTVFQRRKVAYRLRLLGQEVGENASLERLAEGVAKVKGIPFPTSRPERSLLVRNFSQERVQLPGELERPDFVPLVVSEAMHRALARAHELYAIPSLMDRLAAEGSK